MKDFAKRINSKKSSKKNKSVNQRFITKKSFKNPFSLKTGLTLVIISAISAFVLINSMLLIRTNALIAEIITRVSPVFKLKGFLNDFFVINL